MFKRNVNYGFVGVRHGHWTGAPPSYHDHRHDKRPSSEPSLPTVFDQNTVPNTETPTEYRRPPYLAVMIEMCADGYGYEDIHIELKKRGFSVSKAACRQFVIPKARRPAVTGAGEAGRISAGEGAGT